MNRQSQLAFVRFLLILEIAITAPAQTHPGLSGIVHDSSGAVVAGADVTLLNAHQATVAQAANEEVGVHLQRTSPSIAGIFVRGLTPAIALNPPDGAIWLDHPIAR